MFRAEKGLAPDGIQVIGFPSLTVIPPPRPAHVRADGRLGQS